MIFKRLLCLCTPGSSYRQVAPSEKEHDDDDVSGMQLMLFNIKKKFNNEESDTNNGNIERDCFSLVENIRIDGRDVTHSLFADPTCIVILTFDDATLSSVLRGEGVHTGISKLRMLAGKTILRVVSLESSESDLRVLVSVISSFLDISQRQQRLSYTSRSQLSKHFLNTLSSEGSLVLTVIPNTSIPCLYLHNEHLIFVYLEGKKKSRDTNILVYHIIRSAHPLSALIFYCALILFFNISPSPCRIYFFFQCWITYRLRMGLALQFHSVSDFIQIMNDYAHH